MSDDELEPYWEELRVVAKPGETEVERLKRVLRWYAWPDRYLPRYEGVGRAGIGSKYYPNVESDLGRFAREALGADLPPDFERSVPVTQSLLKKIREEAADREQAEKERLIAEDRTL